MESSTCTCGNSNYLKSIAFGPLIGCVEIMYLIDIVSKRMTIAIATNVSINCRNKKVRNKMDCYILYAVVLVIILLLIITVICYHYVKQRSKQKGIDTLTIKNGK